MLDRQVSWLLAAALATVACRYSNSETPPPLEPDFEQLRAERLRASAKDAAAAGAVMTDDEGPIPPAEEDPGADRAETPSPEPEAAGNRLRSDR